MPGAVILLDRVVWNENYFLNRELSILVFLKFSYEFGIGKEKERKCLLKSNICSSAL